MKHLGRMKCELENLFLPIGDEKKEWMLSKNLKRLIGLNRIWMTLTTICDRF